MPWGKHGMQHKEEPRIFCGKLRNENGRPRATVFFVAMWRGLQRFDSGVHRIVVWLYAWVRRDINEANDAFGIEDECCAD